MNDETILVAPNESIAKLWRKEYPGIKVVLSQPLPTNEPKRKPQDHKIKESK